ncbi:cysteine proteinase [Pleurotus eryngii]|uniref:Cysteine proteinase n=1 Tax=Pleurotus eryngii TaxID=5323 RepID=A0A9P6A487_PLEER|nr:cysteine proteinase [Pleurotus eryngii]
MSLFFNIFGRSQPAGEDIPQGKGTFQQQERQAGLLVTAELDKALEECKARVAAISKLCRAKNQKYRDIEFDIENDRELCLYGLQTENPPEPYTPSDVQRVTQVFDKPQFFVDGADANDIVQGALGDCWFLSALAMMATAKGLVEKFCVARDEVVGVYGFVFFRDSYWVPVVIDDMLYTSIPKFEELNRSEKHLYHNSRDNYNKLARKGNKTLYFAKSGTEGETWVPLLEKAYAKLHGDYASLSGGEASEAVEDLTGGVATIIPVKDILDIDKFWHDELCKANVDRLFGCSFDSLDTTRSGEPDVKVSGLIGGHAYSVLRAVECRGKRFVILRNPWGKSEWTGPWSDGSKEWSAEWLEILPEIDHVFGEDGQFVMEYSDFLDCWDQIDRTLLFDSSWLMSSQWLRVVTQPLPSAWTYGDVSFTISVPEPTTAVIVLSKLDDRYFEDLSGQYWWNFNFILFKTGEPEILAESSHARLWSRSVNVELELEAGDYVLHVRVDRKYRRDNSFACNMNSDQNKRKLSRVETERAKGQSIATNINSKSRALSLPRPLAELAGKDLKTLSLERKKAQEEVENAKKKDEKPPVPAEGGDVDKEPVVEPQTSNERKAEAKDDNKPAPTDADKGVIKDEPKSEGDAEQQRGEKGIETDEAESEPFEAEETKTDHRDAEGGTASVPPDDEKESAEKDEATKDTEDDKNHKDDEGDGSSSESGSDSSDESASVDGDYEADDENAVFLGLRVYTKKSAPAAVAGQVRYQIDA